MKTRSKPMVGPVALAWALFVLCMVTQAFGSIVIMDAYREVGVSGVARGGGLGNGGQREEFRVVESRVGPGAFIGDVAGVAEGSDPVISWPGVGSEHAEARATQQGFVGSEVIRAVGSLGVETWVALDQWGLALASAWSLLEVTFQVWEPVMWEMEFSRSLFQPPPVFPIRELSLSGLNSGYVIAPGQLGLVSGTLMPDVYTLSMRNEVSAYFVDPFVQFGGGEYDLEMRFSPVASVPDTGSTLLLLGMGLVGLLVIKRRMTLA